MNAECDGFAVVKDSDGQVMGCHRTLGQAERQMVALYAIEDDANEDEGPTHTMPDGTVMDGASHPRAEGYAPTSAMIAEAIVDSTRKELDDVERLLRSLTPNRSDVEEMLASWRVSD